MRKVHSSVQLLPWKLDGVNKSSDNEEEKVLHCQRLFLTILDN